MTWELGFCCGSGCAGETFLPLWVTCSGNLPSSFRGSREEEAWGAGRLAAGLHGWWRLAGGPSSGNKLLWPQQGGDGRGPAKKQGRREEAREVPEVTPLGLRDGVLWKVYSDKETYTYI